MSTPGQNEPVFDQVRILIPAAMQLAVRLCGNVHDAEDILQESLLKAAQNLPSFRGDASLSTWLMRILVNVWRTAGRRARGAPTLTGLSDHGEITAVTESSPPDAEKKQQIAAAVSRLPDRQREVLVLTVYEELSASDVASVLGITVQNVYSNLSAARAQLRQTLASDLIS